MLEELRLGSQCQQRASGGLARLKVAVRLLHIGQRVALVNPDSDLATGHHGLQLIRH